MNNLTQAPPIAGTSEPSAKLLPLYYARSMPSPDGMETSATRYTAAQTLDVLACRLLDGVSNAQDEIHDAQNRLDHGAAYSTAAQLDAAGETLDAAIATLKRLLPMYRALLCGAPMTWYHAHADELNAMLQAQRDRDGGHRFADMDTAQLLDALTEI